MSNQAEGRGAASPVVVFIGLLAVLALVAGGVIWAGQTDEKPIPPGRVATPEPTEDHTLTDAEAIALLKELDRTRLRAFARANADRLSEVFLHGGPALRRAARAIKELKNRNLVLRHVRYDTRDLSIVGNKPDVVKVRQVVILQTVIAGGTSAKAPPSRPKLQRIDWQLRPDHSGDWKIFDGSVLAARYVHSDG